MNSEIGPLEMGLPLRVSYTGDGQAPPMYGMHRHDYCEVVRMISGRGAYKLMDRTIHMAEGDIAVFGPRIPHQFLTESGMAVKRPVILFSESLLDTGNKYSISKECAGAFIREGSSLAYRVGAEESAARRLGECFGRLVYELDSKEYGYQAISLAILSEMAGLLVRRLSEGSRLRDDLLQGLGNLAAAMEYIGENYMRQLRLSEIAAVANLNPSYFSAQFRKVYGITFSEYLTAFRVDKAVWMLSNTDEKITTIASECGFGSMAIFYHHFAHYRGIAPRLIRAGRNTADRPILVCGNGR